MVVKTSASSAIYNCIAWAAGDDTRQWWPDQLGLGYWPPDVVREITLAAFVAAYGTLGYELCGDGSLEGGFVKIVIYTKGSTPTHAARQLSNGNWTSKLGRDVDVEHDSPEAILVEIPKLAGLYGLPTVYLRKPMDVGIFKD